MAGVTNKPTKKSGLNKASAGLLAGILLLVALGYLPGWLGASGWRDLVRPAQADARQGTLRVHFIDVGQGDSILIQAQGEAMLIDGGERGQEETVIAYLKAQGVAELRYVVATHPHSDHIGGLAYGVLAAFPVREVIAPRLPESGIAVTRTYEAFLTAVNTLVQEQDTKATSAQPGQTYQLGDAVFTILGPLAASDNVNNNSVVLRLEYGAFALLLTGDAESAAETQLIERWGAALDADLMKAGHHGSNTSSTLRLLELVTPEAVVISCGAGNSYGHPHPAILDRLLSLGVQIYRTDLEGSLVFDTDGDGFWREEAA
ncbi:MAG: MBL fold metallo-hydrolase [Oscillospiraceae bacterium]|jgi:competence protein ComEC|nr:MBL fold metallo-hydrolase [Oscillospiraceae bacterium]